MYTLYDTLTSINKQLGIVVSVNCNTQIFDIYFPKQNVLYATIHDLGENISFTINKYKYFMFPGGNKKVKTYESYLHPDIGYKNRRFAKDDIFFEELKRISLLSAKGTFYQIQKEYNDNLSQLTCEEKKNEDKHPALNKTTNISEITHNNTQIQEQEIFINSTIKCWQMNKFVNQKLKDNDFNVDDHSGLIHCFRLKLPGIEDMSLSIANVSIPDQYDNVWGEIALINKDGWVTYCENIGYNDVKHFSSLNDLITEINHLIYLNKNGKIKLQKFIYSQ